MSENILLVIVFAIALLITLLSAICIKKTKGVTSTCKRIIRYLAIFFLVISLVILFPFALAIGFGIFADVIFGVILIIVIAPYIHEWLT